MIEPSHDDDYSDGPARPWRRDHVFLAVAFGFLAMYFGFVIVLRTFMAY